MIEIRLFGSPQVMVDGRPPSKIPTRKSVLLLAHLALNDSKPADRNALAFELWPDVTESRARRNLNTEIWRLKQSVGEAIVAYPTSVQFSTDGKITVDACIFESVPAGASIEELEGAIATYHGEFLAGYFDDWVLVKREHYQDRLIQYVDRCAKYYQSNAMPRKAIELVKRILTYNPLHEESHQRLMRLYAQTGDHASAIQQYRQCAGLLESELGLKPMPETEFLFQRIVEESQKGRGKPGHIVQPEEVFIGRGESLRELNLRWDKVLQGHTQAAIVTGESGIGKTRLVEHWLDGVQHQAIILRGHCSEMGQREPYLPVAEMIQSALREFGGEALKGLPVRIQNEIGRLIPALSAEVENVRALPPAQAREQLINALVTGLRAWSSTEKPLVLFLDDLQWADDETMDVVRAALRVTDDAPMMFVATYRPDPLALVEDRQNDIRIQQVDIASLRLDSFSRGEVGELIWRLGKLPDAPQAFAERIHAETEGNPLFVIESLRGMFDEGLLSVTGDGVWAIALDYPVAELRRLPISANIRQTITNRVEKLNEDQRDLLSLAAIVGGEFDAERLRSISAKDEQTIRDALSGLTRYSLLREDPSGRFRFSHVKIQEVLAASLPESKRKEIHLAVARDLESQEMDGSRKPLERLAYHYHQAGDEAKALDLYKRAGDQAIAYPAYKVAAAHFESALALCKKPSEVEQRFGLLMKLFLCVWSTDSDHLRLGKILEEARQLAEDSQQSEWLARVYYHSGVNLISQGKWVDAENLLSQSIEHAVRSEASNIEMQARMELANILQYMRRGDEAIPHIETALSLAERAGDIRIAGRARWDLTQLSAGVADQARVGIEIIQRAFETKTLSLLIDLCSSVIAVVWRAGNPGGAIELAEKIIAYGREQGLSVFVKSATRILARVYCAIGEYEKATQLASESLRASRLTGYRYGEMRSLICLALANAGMGFYDDALETMNRAMDLCEQFGSKSDLSTARLETVDILLQQGDEKRMPTAEALARQTLGDGRGVGLRGAEIFALAHLSQILIAKGCVNEAVEFSREAVGLMESPENKETGQEPFVYFNHFLALQRSGDVRASHFLEKARGLLYYSVTTLPLQLRRGFLRHNPRHQMILQAKRT